MQNHHRTGRAIAVQVVSIPFATLFSMFIACSVVWAQSDDALPPAEEPMLAESGDWAADFNDAQIACYEGSMAACDSIWLNERVLMDTFLYNYGRTCGGRVDLRAIRREEANCVDVFPGYE
jgi:hypothetical protein